MSQPSALIVICAWGLGIVRLARGQELDFNKKRMANKTHTRSILPPLSLMKSWRESGHSPQEVYKMAEEYVSKSSKNADTFERWLTDDLPATVHLGDLRRAFERGLSRDEAVREARR